MSDLLYHLLIKDIPFAEANELKCLEFQRDVITLLLGLLEGGTRQSGIIQANECN
jgi:hypothetical protein